MSKIQIKPFVFLIVALAFLLRFWQLGNIPMSMNWDETAWGYNAYSLGIDGKDEFGKLLPFQYLESFGDFKPPIYAYLDILPIKLFGLTEFATRFPSAFFGSLTVLITFFLVKRIFITAVQKEQYAITAALFLAISPWHINLSRAAFEANVSTFFLICGIWLFLAGVQKKNWYLVFSAVSFTVSFYVFNTARVVAPLLVITLAIGFRDELLLRKKEVATAIFIGLIFLLPLVPFLLSPQAKLRFQEVNIFTDITVIQQVNQEIINDHKSWWSKVIHNRRVAFAQDYLKHYFDNFNPNFLFITGDNNIKFTTRDVGEMYFFDIPFVIAGIFLLFKKRESNWWIIPVWALLGVIPAATARETPHALRIETIIPTMQILSAYGFSVFIVWLQKIYQQRKNSFNFIICTIILVLFLNVLYYLHGYYFHYDRESAGDWNYGYKQSIAYVSDVQSNYNQVYITNKLGRPYIYYLFYMKVLPSVFRKDAIIHRDVFGFVEVEQFGKYYFAENLNQIKNVGGNVLYINSASATPNNAHIKKIFKLPDGSSILTAYTL